MLKYLIVVILCLLAGCGSTSDQRIEMLEQGIVQAEASAGQVDIYIADLQTAIAEAKLLLQDPALGLDQKGDVLKFLTDAESALQITMEKKTAIEKSLRDFKNSIVLLKEQGSGLSTELKMIGEGINSVSANLPPPLSGYGVLLGTMLTVIGGLFGKKQGLRSADKTVDGIVGSVNDLIEVSSPENASIIKATLKDSQIKAGIRDKVVASLNRVA